MTGTNTNELQTEAISEMARQQTQRFKKETMAAWRAGYESLSVLMYPPKIQSRDDGGANVNLPRTVFIPGNHEAVSDYVNSVTVYDLTKIDQQQYEEFTQ